MKTKLRISLIITGIVLFIFMTLNSRAQDNTPWWENWVKHNHNPVMTGISGTWCHNVLFPVVIQNEAILKLWYSGQSSIFAISYAEEGQSWPFIISFVMATPSFSSRGSIA